MKKFGEIVMLEVFALLLLFVGTLWAGSIYKWVDENGVVSYSNVAPPEDEADVGVIEETRQDESAQASQDEVTSPSATQEAAAKDEHIKAKPLREKYVTQRIEELERSIEEIQKQLKQRPHDESLERALTFKKENLRKYKQAVETGNY
jgi:hypothetical protein